MHALAGLLESDLGELMPRIESTINSADRGIVRFRFDNVEFGVGPHGTGQTVTNNLPMTFDVLTDGTNLRELADMQMSCVISLTD